MPVFNAPFSNTRSVAELIIAEIVMLSRHLGDRVARGPRRARGSKVAVGSHEVRGQTLGIVGYGHIGSQVGVLAEAFGMRVVFYDIAAKLPMGNNRSMREARGRARRVATSSRCTCPRRRRPSNMIGARRARAA